MAVTEDNGRPTRTRKRRGRKPGRPRKVSTSQFMTDQERAALRSATRTLTTKIERLDEAREKVRELEVETRETARELGTLVR